MEKKKIHKNPKTFQFTLQIEKNRAKNGHVSNALANN